MTQEKEIDWNPSEKLVAQRAFQTAYDREMNALIEVVRAKASEIAELDDLWYLNDFLSARRHDIDGKYDYQYSDLIFIFARLVKEGWLKLDELEGLDRSKLSKIAALVRM